MTDRPSSFQMSPGQVHEGHQANRVLRRLSDMRGFFSDQEAYRQMLDHEDPLVYEVLESKRPGASGELVHGFSVIHPGTVGKEYFMTKGHFHRLLEAGEVYYCVQGEGLLVMEAPEGDWSVEEMKPGAAIYVPPRWGHRSVNTNLKGDLVMLFVYPANAGHDYESIERRGFRKIVLECDGRHEVVDNPNWRPSA